MAVDLSSYTKVSGGSGGYLTPPVVTLADGTLEITDYVKGVDLIEYEYNDKDSAVFTFKDASGRTIRKYIQDPYTRQHIMKLEDEDQKDKYAGYTYGEVISMYKSFFYPNVVASKVGELGENPTFKALCDALGELINVPADDKSRSTREVWLKVGFKDAVGEKPQYTIPSSRWIGNEGYEPLWENPKGVTDPKFWGIKQFSTQAKTPTNFTPDGEINDIFGGSSI